MDYRILWIISILFSVQICFGQNSHTISGIVVSGADREPVMAMVIIKEQEKTLGYAEADAAGRFSVTFRSDADFVTLQIRALGYASIEEKVSCFERERVYVLKEEHESLRESVIRSPRIESSGDTVKYNVASFVSKQDIAIEDVLKRMPGISVLESGKILYNGRAVSLTIDGMDMLKSRYALATRNIPHEMIASVEILENDQVIKALQDLVPGDKTTLNLKLKSSARGVWVWPFGIESGWGYPDHFLRDIQASPIYLGQRHQHILTASHNNTGKDLGETMADMSGGSSLSFTNIPSGGPGQLASRRYTFNNDWAVTSNNLFKTSRERTIVANAGYLHERRSRESSLITEWLLPGDSTTLAQEQIGFDRKREQLYGDFSFTRNAPAVYLNGIMKVSAEQDAKTGRVNELAQSLSARQLKLDGNFHAIRRSAETSAYDLSTRLSALHREESFIVKNEPGQTRDQEVLYDNIRFSLFASQYQEMHLKGKWTFSPSAGISYGGDRLVSSLNLPAYQPENGLTYDNNLFLNQFDARISASFRYRAQQTTLYIGLPAGYRFRSLSDINQMTEHRLIVEPSLQIHHRINAETAFEFRYNLTHNDPAVTRLHRGVLMTTYRNYRFYTPDFTSGRNHNFTIQWDYKDVLKMLFLTTNIRYRLLQPRILYGQELDGIISHSISTPTDKMGHSLNGSFDLSKSFYRVDASMKFGIMAGISRQPVFTQGVVSDMLSSSIEPSVSFQISPLKWLSLSESVRCSWVQQRLAEASYSQHVITGQNKTDIEFSFMENLSLVLNGDVYYTTAYDNHFFILADASIHYKIGKSRLSLRWSNIFNTREYACIALTPESSTTTAYSIRPTEITIRWIFTL